MLKRIKTFIIDLECLFRATGLYLFLNYHIDRSGNGPGIMLVHAFLHNDSVWGYFYRYLHKRGFGPINTITYHSYTKNIKQNAQLLKERIDFIQTESGKPIEILIGHSMGGLISLEYALEYAPKDKIIFVITMGSPLHGSYLASLAKRIMGPSGRDTIPDSPYINSLQKKLRDAKHIQVLNFASKTDLFIQPWDSAILKNLLYAEFVVFDDIGHMTYLFSDRVLKHIVDYLRTKNIHKK
jgi:hypothetical protein